MYIVCLCNGSVMLLLLFLFSVEYSPKLVDSDPQLLLQQQIPHSFITLQDSIREVVAKHRLEQHSPIMEDSQFL